MIDVSDPDPIQTLANALGEDWPAIQDAKFAGFIQIDKLSRLVAKTKPPTNTSVVAFGSIARKEWTSKSDVDWTFIVDGPSGVDHFPAMEDVRKVLKDFKGPGPTETFGTLTSSHPLVHEIGGNNDTNQNMTRRLLLLLESEPLSGKTTHSRLCRAILERYIVCDSPVSNALEYRIPRFLLNDVVRLWRTFAVDYATKKWERSNEGWALRNIKLRMSRKLLFAKGMLLCFACEKTFAGSPSTSSLDEINLELLSYCYELSRVPPLAFLASALHNLAPKPLASRILRSYDQFIELLNNEDRRNHLEGLSFDNSEDDVFQHERNNSREFRDGLLEFFFDSDQRLAHLTRRYGVF
ncbi:hypothetical protein Pan97_00060 [Bremerella volcania]|uniref:Polymerase nucleotidyl transferase domain-containing protein n=1 Tax=Bremerella volcania TaxID=2527984 RepID=A0A518C1F0_9BACT|nr:nucleotidyltransferase domain-containing protein [Bremerella volcania]QDU73040.1 hypothetical protein Pan97_00060 [Bremerella volcania]